MLFFKLELGRFILQSGGISYTSKEQVAIEAWIIREHRRVLALFLLEKKAVGIHRIVINSGLTSLIIGLAHQNASVGVDTRHKGLVCLYKSISTCFAHTALYSQ